MNKRITQIHEWMKNERDSNWITSDVIESSDDKLSNDGLYRKYAHELLNALAMTPNDPS